MDNEAETGARPADGGTDAPEAPPAEESKPDEVEEYARYIESTDLKIYLQDAVVSCLENGSMARLQGNSEEKTARFGRWMASYFDSMLAGRHVFGRRLGFVMATRYNRLSFVHMVTRLAVDALGSSQQAAAAQCGQWRDMFCLVQLVCPEYPDTVVRAAFMLAQFYEASVSGSHAARKSENVAESGPVRLSVLLCTFELYVRFAEFVQRCGRGHKALLRERELNLLTEYREDFDADQAAATVTTTEQYGQEAWRHERTPVLCRRWLETLTEDIYQRCDAAEKEDDGGGDGEHRSSGSYDRPLLEAVELALAATPDKLSCNLPELLLRIAQRTTCLVNRLPATSGEAM